jgi:hypothetical protein
MFVPSSGPAQPLTIHLETARFIHRTIDSGDATEEWCKWMLEPSTLKALNAAPINLDVAMIRSYIATFDRKKSHLLGIFDKADGKLIGIRAIYVDWHHREFMVNILIGQVGQRSNGAMRETRDALYHVLFEDWGLEIVRASVLASNAFVNTYMQAEGWSIINRTLKRAAASGEMIEVLEYQMTRDQHRRYERKRGLLYPQAKAS